MAEGEHEDDWTLCVGDHYEHDWSDIPRGGSGECPRCGAELIDEDEGDEE